LELEEIKGDKQPIGKYATSFQFSNHTVELNSGDMVYLSSDGYADQFGGERGKKFKSVNFKKLLFDIRANTMQEQQKLLQDTFKKWKGDLEQLDDVCVIGFRA
jgi:serine phosphatase RsbU (regulator of sigma subunit)